MSRRPPLVVVGDALLDRDVEGVVERVAPDAPVPVVDEREVRSRPGGAGLAAVLATSEGRNVVLITALGADAAGRWLRSALVAAGVDVVDLGLGGPTPEKIRVRAGGQSLLRVDRGGTRSEVGPLRAAAREAIARAGAILVADYGGGVAAEPAMRRTLEVAARAVPLVWDPHRRGPDPVRGAMLVTPNAGEAASFAAGEGHAALPRRWGAAHVCVTLGAEGALLVDSEGRSTDVPTDRATGGDPCGAGDRFASRAAELLADGLAVEAAVAGAVVTASAFVAAGGAAGVAPRSAPPALHVVADGLPADVAEVVARTRSCGGTVVATGGCFDLLHAGHVRTLEAARREGDCLIVLLNSDAGVRRLKGPRRPLVAQADRAAVLRSLRPVDAVLIFEEDTPTAALERLRPDVWAKGGDYVVDDLPEAEALAGWDARIALLPHLAGRSTTRLIEEAAVRAVS